MVGFFFGEPPNEGVYRSSSTVKLTNLYNYAIIIGKTFGGKGGRDGLGDPFPELPRSKLDARIIGAWGSRAVASGHYFLGLVNRPPVKR